MPDILAHYHMYDFRARCVVAVTTDLVREAQRRHGLDPITTIAVGRALSCAAMLASTLKAGKDYIHCSFAGENGPLNKVLAECNGDGECRGYAVPARIGTVTDAAHAPTQDPKIQDLRIPQSIGEAMGGKGVLTVTRAAGASRQPYTAMSAFENGEIASDVARYLTDSEQIPSAVAAGVKLDRNGQVLGAGGVLVQRLGGAELEEDVLRSIEHRMRLQLNLSERIAHGESCDQIVSFLQGGQGTFGALTTRALCFRCSCSRSKMANALAALGEEQLKDIRRETGKIEVRCPYCEDTQLFRLEELISH